MVRNAGNKAQLRPAGAGALPELGNNNNENNNDNDKNDKNTHLFFRKCSILIMNILLYISCFRSAE